MIQEITEGSQADYTQRVLRQLIEDEIRHHQNNSREESTMQQRDSSSSNRSRKSLQQCSYLKTMEGDVKPEY